MRWLLLAVVLLTPGCCTGLVKDGLLVDALEPPPIAVGAAEVRGYRDTLGWYVEEVDVAGKRQFRTWSGTEWRGVGALPPGVVPVEVEVTARDDEGRPTVVVLRDAKAEQRAEVGRRSPSPPSPIALLYVLLIPLTLAVDIATSPLQLLALLGVLALFKSGAIRT